MKTFTNFSKKFFNSPRSLLFPMLVLAFGIHAALLAVPLPFDEEQKEPDNKKNPITVTQIPAKKPTQKPTQPASTSIAKVAVPAMNSETEPTATTSETATADPLLADQPIPPTNQTVRAISEPTPSPKAVAETPASPALQDVNDYADNSNSESATKQPSEKLLSSETETTQKTEDEITQQAFAEFPHFQPSEKDCYKLGFGENCRIVENMAIAQVVDFFQTELPAHDYAAQLITNQPTHKVFKVVKADKTLFLNIWQNQQKVSYLLAGVIYNQSPEEISRKVKSMD